MISLIRSSARGERAQPLAGPVARAVVDEDQLEVDPVERRDGPRVERADHVLLVVHRRDDADQSWLAHRVSVVAAGAAEGARGRNLPQMDEARLESELFEVGRRLAAALPATTRNPFKAADGKAMELASQDAELKAALFRFVDVVPACRSLDDLARHLTGFLGEVEAPPPPVAVAMRMGNTRAGRTALGAAAAAGVKHMAHRFIVGESPKAALGTLRELWKDGVASSVDLLGEATVTQAEAQRYAERCDAALETLATAARDWPERPALERDSAGALPRANLSVKVSALTPLLRPDAPERGKRDAADRLRGLLRRARDLDAHLHIDMESLDSRDAVLELVLELLAEEEFRAGPSAGMVLQAYLRDSPQMLDTVLDWSAGAGAARAHPLTVRLVKGAYWDHEVVEAAQHGWNAPVFEVKADSDRNFEQLTRRLLDVAAGAARRDRLAQPALDRPRDRVRPALGRRRRRPRAAGPARARRPAPARDRRAGPARAHLLPGRRPRRRHGLPRAAAAGEHLERLVPRRPGEGDPARAAARAAGRDGRPMSAYAAAAHEHGLVAPAVLGEVEGAVGGLQQRMGRRDRIRSARRCRR